MGPHWRQSTQTRVICIPIIVLEELATYEGASHLFWSFTETLHHPFRELHESWTACDVRQLALSDFNTQLALLVVHRPRASISLH